MVDKKTNRRIALKLTYSERAVTSTYRRKLLPNVRVLEKRATSDIPQEYKEFRKLFKEELGKEALPKHQEWDYEIILKKGKKPEFQPIYGMSKKELQELKTYININIKKGFIRLSESLAGFPVMFVPKKNRKLQLCVDF
jgi:hypothetical protein